MANKEVDIRIRVEPDLKAHVVEYFRTQPVNLSEYVREVLIKQTKFKRKLK